MFLSIVQSCALLLGSPIAKCLQVGKSCIIAIIVTLNTANPYLSTCVQRYWCDCPTVNISEDKSVFAIGKILE